MRRHAILTQNRSSSVEKLQIHWIYLKRTILLNYNCNSLQVYHDMKILISVF
jgi:hypothetical protein